MERVREKLRARPDPVAWQNQQLLPAEEAPKIRQAQPADDSDSDEEEDDEAWRLEAEAVSSVTA